MKTILVPTDFSPAALNAARYAVNMAKAIYADIFLLHVYQIPMSYTEIPLPMTEQDMIQGAENKMNNLKEELTALAMGRIDFEAEVTTGIFFPELEAMCRRLSPYAVIMGSQGTTAADRFFFGGHAVYAMKHLMWPLITVPPKARFSSIKKIGLTCDFERMVDTLPAEEIVTLVNDFGAELHVLNTGKKEKFDPELIFSSELLERMLKPVKPEYHFISSRNTDDGIIDFADDNRINLLILLPKRHSLIEKLIHRSHTRDLVLHSHVPVMALHHVNA